MKSTALVLLSLTLSACAVPGWNGRVESWGTMSEVMRDGQTQGRVSVLDEARRSNVYGIGALAGLQGEIAIFDGVAWISRVNGTQIECDSGARPQDQATLLAISEVRKWKTIAIDRDLEGADLDAFLAGAAHQFGMGDRPWPFVIEGDFADVDAHVLNGQCPYAGAVDPEHEPIRQKFPLVRARMVGFFAPAAVGQLVHHGQAMHVHILVEEPELYVGHVESVKVQNGAWLRVPALD